MQSYELVPAKTYEEALEKTKLFIGQKAVVKEIHARANSDGTYTVWPEFDIVEEKKSAS